MGCVIVVLALILPRVLMFGAWLLTGWFGDAFESRLWPVLGFLFMPYTTLAYMAAMLRNDHELSGVWLAVVVLAVIFDMGHWTGASRGRKRRR